MTLGRITLTNSTLSDNVSTHDGGAIYFGGGPIFPNAPELEITDSTISGNRADRNGGGLHVDTPFQKASLHNTIIAGNSAISGPDCYHEYDALSSHGFNLIGDDSGCAMTTAPTDLIGVAGDPIDPLLDVLQNNGGPTRTRALLPGSLAIDNGPPSCNGKDQRGTQRPVWLRLKRERLDTDRLSAQRPRRHDLLRAAVAQRLHL